MRMVSLAIQTCKVVPDGAGVDLFEAGTTGASGGAARDWGEEVSQSDLVVDETVEIRG